ncbi:MAG: hypothetical protein M3081_12635 [Gemmatimonadota bacterium]|nr:hypothetical protein [Gemmatimonadota bacterium]
MTLGECAYVLNVEPKWVQNVAAAVGGSLPYTLPTARRLALVRALAAPLGMPIPRAWVLSAELLEQYDRSRGGGPIEISTEDGTVTVMVDVYRVLAAVNAGLSRLRVAYAPRRRGRSSRARRDAIARAAEYGIDLTLLAANLQRTPVARLRQLDAMIDFRRRVRRAPASVPRRAPAGPSGAAS